MICDVILTKKENKYTAKAREWPDIEIEEDTRDQAIEEIKKAIV